MTRIAVAISLASLAGCSSLFGLDPPTLATAPSDAAADADAPPVDALVDGPSADVPPAACPASYTAVAGGYYREVNAQADWLDAVADCADDGGVGGKHTHLIVFDDMAELTGANALLSADTWIGLSDRVTEGTYLWVTTQNTNNFPPASGTPWAGGGPGMNEMTDCVLLRSAGTLEDVQCTSLRHYACECDAYANDPTRY